MRRVRPRIDRTPWRAHLAVGNMGGTGLVPVTGLPKPGSVNGRRTRRTPLTSYGHAVGRPRGDAPRVRREYRMRFCNRRVQRSMSICATPLDGHGTCPRHGLGELPTTHQPQGPPVRDLVPNHGRRYARGLRRAQTLRVACWRTSDSTCAAPRERQLGSALLAQAVQAL